MRRASLNHVFRLIWSEKKQAFIPVAETAKSHVKSSGTKLVASVVASMAFTAFSYAGGVVVAPTSGATNVYTASNGILVVNINTANGAGLSHNKYTDYNVDPRGLVLNNGNSSQVARQSQLVGQVVANTNLDAEAKFILNEVVSPNRSLLQGYTEVVGGKADVIVANPYGVTCSGCGFINTDVVTLTTGTPNISSAGALNGFTVNQGDVLITGKGLDGTAQSYLDVVTRSIKVESQINAKDLKLITGTNTWDYATKTATAITSTGTAPNYAIDSSALGGMYANRIFIKATENGVGVKMLGEAAATADDFTLNANGTIDIGSKISANRDIAVSTTSNVTNAITLTDANLAAKHDVTLSATQGGASLNGGVLVADNNLNASFGTLNDTLSTTAITDNNKRFAGNALTLSVLKATTLDGTNWGTAAGAFSADVGNLTIGSNSEKLYSGSTLNIAAHQGDLAFNSAGIKSIGNLTLTSDTGAINTTMGTEEGIQSTTGNINLISATGLTNAGTISADKGSLTLKMDNAIVNTGTLHASTAVDMTDQSSNGTETLTNSGSVLSDGSLSAKVSTLTNSGTVQNVSNATVAATTLNNTGSVLLSTSGTNAGIVNVSALTNSGTLQSSNDLTINASSSVTNSGNVLASHDLTLNGNTAALTLINNASGVLQATNALSIASANTAWSTQAGKVLGNSVNLTLASLTNTGVVQSNADMTYHIGTTLDNSGTLLAKTTLNGASATLTNSGTFEGTTTTNLTETTLNNTGTLTAASDANSVGTLNIANVTNSGTLQSKHDLTINASSSVTNSGKVLASHDLILNGNASALTLTNSASGVLQATNALTIASANTAWSTQAGKVLGNSVNLTLASLTNAGVVQSNNSLTYTLSGGLNNNGLIFSQGSLVGHSQTVNNSSTGGIASLGDMSLTTTGNMTNQGSLYTQGNMNLTAGADFDNSSQLSTGGGIVGDNSAGKGDVTINGNNIKNSGDISGKNITATAQNSFYNGLASAPTIVSTWSSPFNSRTIYDLEHDCSWLGGGCSHFWVKEEMITRTESLSYTPSYKPKMLASGTMSIQWGAGGAQNIAGILSANTLNLSGLGSFINNDLHTDTVTYTRHWVDDYDSNYHKFLYVSNPSTFNNYNDINILRTTWTSAGTSESLAQAVTFLSESGRGTNGTVGAGIFAGTLHYTGGALVNRGSAYATLAKTTPTATGLVIGGSLATGTTASTVQSPINFGGLSLALPSNPNGYFVLAKNPKAGYLIETNPLYGLGQNFIGSTYLTDRLGLNTDQIGLRLGDSAYEAYLIRQQVIAQTGRNVLKGYENENKMLESLYTAGAESGFTFGKAPTPEQLSHLTKDVVWMVEEEVAGQKVLAPVVYLAQSTKDAVDTGAVITATDMDIDAKSLTNTGGTIASTGTLAVKTKEDITNASGTIKGGNVSLVSTEGSIKNETSAKNDGGDTVIGKKGSIESTGTLNLDAKKDVTVLGADVKAKGDASIAAGNKITFDTIVDKKTTASTSNKDGATTNTQTTTEKNIGSNLDIGGNLKLKNGGDTTLAGTKATVSGDLTADTGGSFNVVARQDKETTKTSTSQSGLGVGGGFLSGETTTTTDHFKGTNMGSTLDVGGKAKIASEKDVVIQGSDVNIAGNASVKAKGDIKVLDGLDEEKTTTRTETTSVLSFDSSSSAGAGAEGNLSRDKAKVAGSGSAQAEANNGSEVNFYKKTVTTDTKSQKTSVASHLNVGGDLDASTEGTVTVQGSEINAGGDATIEGKKGVNVLAGRNETIETSSTSTTKVGAFSDSNAQASASGQGTADGLARKGNASGKASASADTTTTIGVRTETSDSSHDVLTHTASGIKSGGNMKIKTEGTATFQGANVESGGNMNIDAKNINNLAAEDHDTTTSSSSRQTAGLYVGGQGEAKGSASGSNKGGKADGEVSGEVSAGLRYASENSDASSGTTTNQTNSFKSGGDFTRTATGTIRDQGTQVEASGKITQSATTIKDEAISDKTWDNSSSSSHDARLGGYAGASANANSKGEASADASAGIKGSYQYNGQESNSGSSKAVTSGFKAGDTFESTSKDKTTLVGTNIEAGNGVTIKAKSLDYQAAHDTTTESETTRDANAEVKAGLVGKPSLDASAGFNQDKSAKSSSTAVVGNIASNKGAIKIETKDNTRLEGTKIDADSVSVHSEKGDVLLDAAKSTTTGSSQNIKAEANLGLGKAGEVDAGASGGYSQAKESTSTSTATSITSRSGDTDIAAGKSITSEGAQLNSGGNVNLSAKDNVNLLEAKDTSTSVSGGINGSVGFAKGEEGEKSKSAGVDAKVEYSSSAKGTATQISSAGKINVTAGTVVSQEANLKGETQVTGKQENRSLSNSDVNLKGEISKKVESEVPAPTPQKDATSKTVN